MSKKINLLKKLGEKVADTSVHAKCIPFFIYQPKPPAKILAKMQESK